MLAYTNLNLNQVKEIAAQYQLGDVMSKKILSGGSENSNYHLVTSSGEYVLTLCENKTKEETQKLASILLLLEANNYKTSKLIKLPDGNYISSFDGRPILVKEFIHGKVQNEFKNEQLFKIGALIAKLHNIPIPEYLSHTPSYGIESFRKHKLPDGFFKDWLSNIQKIIDPCLELDLPVAMIHADIFDSNIIMTEEGPVIMDFEEVCIYNCTYDLGMAIAGTCVYKEEVNISKAHHLISGYRSVNELSNIEKEYLPRFITYAAAATAFWRFIQFNILVPDEKQKDRYLEMVHIADNAKTISIKEFII